MSPGFLNGTEKNETVRCSVITRKLQKKKKKKGLCQKHTAINSSNMEASKIIMTIID